MPYWGFDVHFLVISGIELTSMCLLAIINSSGETALIHFNRAVGDAVTELQHPFLYLGS